MKILKNILVALGIAVAADASAATKPGEPDFAHPRQVLQQAYGVLAATEGDAAAGPQRVKALLEICTAAQSIDPDSVFSLVQLCDDLSAREKAPAAASLMKLVGAKILYQAYSYNSYVYDRLTTPDEPLPADIREWNGRQFKAGVTARLSESLALAKENPTPLADYAAAVEADKRTLLYFPSVADLVACDAVSIYDQIDMNPKAGELRIAMRDAATPGSAAYYYWAVSLLQNAGTSALYNFYMEHIGDEYARMALVRLADMVMYGMEAVSEIYDFVEEEPDEAETEEPFRVTREVLEQLIESSLERFPGYWDNASLQNVLRRIRRGRVSVGVPELVCPGRPFNMDVEVKYLSKAAVNFYAVTNSSSDRYRVPFGSLQLARRLDFDQSKNESSVKYSTPVTLDSPGSYVVYCEADGKVEKPRYVDLWRTVVATPCVPLCFTGAKDQVVAMADFVTGRPVENVHVLVNKEKGLPRKVGTTDKQGLARFVLPGNTNEELSIVTPDGKSVNFGRSLRVQSPWQGRQLDATSYNASILPDRPIYHPGDTVQWAAIVDYSSDWLRTRHAASGLDVEVRFMDANRKMVASVQAVTDAYGRVYGSFATPGEGLTGYFNLQLMVGDRFVSGSTVMVSDYKMPTFEVSDITVFRDMPAAGDVTLRGHAETYSGMPVADAAVSVDINKVFRWRWWQPHGYVCGIKTTTGEDGNFEVVIPAAILKGSQSHDFMADITVTAKTAETASARKSFTNGKPYAINVSGSSQYLRAMTETKLPIDVYDAQGEKVDIKLKWELVDARTMKTAASGTCASMSPVADLDKVRGGYYLLKVAPVDGALANAMESARFIIYNVELNSIPEDMSLLVADTDITTDAKGRAAFRYGVGRDDLWLYAALCVEDKIVEVEVQKRDKGFRHLSLDLPEGADKGVLEIATVVDGKITSYRVNISRPAAPQVKIEAVSFRDRLVPGAGEQWNFKITGPGAADAAMVATMYNHALDALQQMNWPSRFGLAEPVPSMSLNTLSDGKYSASQLAELSLKKTSTLSQPSFKYLHSVAYGRAYNLAAPMMRKMAAVETSEAMAGAALGLSSASDGIMADEAEEEKSLEVSADAGNGAVEQGPDAAEAFNYRDAEVAQAFWMPSVITDGDGNVTLDFTLPDANTTWRFRALAWTAEMKAGSLVRDVVANKPVMVQPNLPRFLRQGDKARVLATIYNNKEEASDVTSVVELFDATTMKVTSTVESVQHIEAGASAVVAIDIDTPVDVIAVGYRVRCTDGTFSDGEQALIPVESAECDVVESQTFYLNPGDKSVSIRIPSDPAGTYTLQYCMNPSWSIVKALPGLVTYDATTATEAVHTLFAACTSAGIVKRNPAVADALKAWKDKAPVSRLEQNDALKTVALNATPWVRAAQGDTERMARLSLLLDPSNARKQIAAAIRTLGKLADADGGLRWGPWSKEPSQWTTSMALHDLGLLRMAGDLPADEALDRMMRNALKYLDRELEKHAEGKVEPNMAYTVVRSMWKDIRPSSFGEKVVEATLRNCASTWRNASTSRKANMAILLSLYGRDAVAKQIISSISEFAVATPAQGLSFPSVADIEQYAPMLIAFGRIDPASALIDGMRQWLVVREQATVGLGASDATQLVGAFMAGGTPWHTDNAPATVTLKGKPVDLGDACSYGGEATVALGSKAAGKTLTVEPGAGVPSYGAVISSYRTQPSQVKAVDCDGLSIEKRMMLVGPDGATSFATEVPLGSRVRVLLTLHVARDMQYVNIVDDRAAALEPVVQTPGMVESGGAYFYRENRDASTRMFIGYLPKGTYQISYDCTANLAGSFAGGLATVQSALAPSLTAHSAGSALEIVQD
ncbi:MAG: hypothetical protein K2L21_06530 [Muribaculaceae bacterium]|nr:hypothetical protein [Muribaculaceae bacterium]